MKKHIKLVALILTVAFILPLSVIGTGAAEATGFHRIEISTGNGISAEKAVIKNGDIYIPAASFSKYTRYFFDEVNRSFNIKGQSFDKAFKSLKINFEEKQIMISGKRIVKLSDCFISDDKIYLPLCQMLPLLDADIYGVHNNIIRVSNPEITMADILYNFDIDDYAFDYSKEFMDSGILAGFYVVPAYIFDTITNQRYDRLDVVSHAGDYNDYKSIFSELLAEDNLYLKAKAYGPDALQEIVNYYTMLQGDSQQLNTLFGWVESASKTADTTNGGALLDLLKDSYNLDEYQKNNLRGINSTWYSGDIKLADCVSAISYICKYLTLVEDNKKMLEVVYKTDGTIGSSEIDRKAAKQVCDLYGNNIEKAVMNEMGLKFAENVTEAVLSPIAIYTNTTKVVGLAFEAVLPYSYSDVAKLPLYADVIASARSVFKNSEMFTDEGAEAKRLSLLLCLLASRKCYQIMAEASDYSSRSYYANKAANAEDLIKVLYLVGENTEFDSFEHFEEHYRSNLEKIKGKEFEVYRTDLPDNSIGNLTEIGYFSRTDRAFSNISSKATTDGTYLFVVGENGIDRYGWDGTVNLTIPGNYSNILYCNGLLIAGGDDGLFTMDSDGNNKTKCFTNGGVTSEFCLWQNKIYYFGEDSYGNKSRLHYYSFDTNGYLSYSISGNGFLPLAPDELGVYYIQDTSFEISRYDPYRPLSSPWYTTEVDFQRIRSGNAFIELAGVVYYVYSSHGYAEERGLYTFDDKGREIQKVIDGVYYDCVSRGSILYLLGDTEGEERNLICYDIYQGCVVAESTISYPTARAISDVIGDYWFLDTSNGVEIVYFPIE